MGIRKKLLASDGVLINSFPYPSMLVSSPEKIILMANSSAIEMGAEIGSECYLSFGKTICPGNEGKCNFCNVNISEGIQEPISTVEHQQDKTCWELHWNKVSDNIFLHFIIDITERKNAEDALIKSEEHYRELVENAQDIIYTMDLHGNLKSINPAAEKLLGYNSSQLTQLNIKDILTPESFVISIQNLNKKLNNSELNTNYEVELVTTEKKIVKIEISSFLRFRDEKPFEIFGVGRDITDRNLAEKSKIAAYKISELVHTLQGLDDLYEAIHDIISGLIPAKNFFIALVNFDDEFISFPYFVDEYDACPAPRKLVNGLTEYIINTGDPLLLEPHNIENFFMENNINIVGKKALYWIGVPLKDKSSVFGIVAVQSYEKNIILGENEKQMLIFVSNQIAQAIIRKRTEFIIQKNEKELNAIITSLDDLVLEINDKLEVLNVWTANPQYVLWYRQNILNKHLQESEDKLFEPFKEAIREVIKNKKSQYIEFQYNMPSSKIWFGAKINSIDDKNKRENKVSILLRDITNKKLIEHELIKAKEKAEQATIAKQQFISNMSHEIRTPINAIKGFTEILLNEKLEKHLIEDVVNIKYSVDNLQHIINEILDSAKIESGNAVFESIDFDLKTLVVKLGESLKALSINKDISIFVDLDENIPGVLIGDPFRLNQILLNITSNAVKFTEKGFVRLNVTFVEKENDRIKIRFIVSDTGIGIPQEKLEIIFDNYSQADYSISRRYGGTGLGLSISKKLVELMDGSISIDSTVNKGTTFTIEICFGISKNQSLQKTDNVQNEFNDLSAVRLLYVEDIELNIILVSKILTGWNIKFDTAINGKIALELLEKNLYDVILLDLQMPEISGFDLIKIIRDTESSVKSHSVPIVIITADAFQETKDFAKNLGIKTFITKPFSQNDLYQAIAGNIRKELIRESCPVSNDEECGTVSNPYKYIDLTILKKMISDNDVSLKNIYEEFLSSSEEGISQLQTLFHNADYSNMKVITHKLKSSFKYLGMKQIEAQMAELDKLCHDEKDIDRIKSRLNEVTNYYENAKKEILTELSGLKIV